jgi:tRNA(fMet)-specific endonuclease VapC
LARFNAEAQRLGVSAITVAELLHGAEKSSDPTRNRAAVNDFCSRLQILDYTHEAAAHYGSIRAALERTGQAIGVNDLHIAAHARSAGLSVVTHNTDEFQRVPGLLYEDWTTDAAPGQRDT